MRSLISAIPLLLLAVTAPAQQLVLQGDNPDPSVAKIGNSYWATATTSNWAPVFPLYESTDLVNWTVRGHVFEKAPDWGDYYFWAPEISQDNGKTYIYYTAHKKGGNLCVAVAVADKPGGPYRDLGPLVCQEMGSIDAFPMRDKQGKLYLVWKEDGNSRSQPTPIWAQEMKEDRTGLIGQPVELFRNNLSWEGGLVEGVSIVREGAYFYAFYSARGCCGTGCDYVTGVARAKDLLGPWEKRDAPILGNEGPWNCQGHGTAVQKDGRNYFLYHGYNRTGTIQTGREGLLREFRFTGDGWIEFVPGEVNPGERLTNVTDAFRSRRPDLNWQWSVFSKPVIRQRKGRLTLSGDRVDGKPRNGEVLFIGRKLESPSVKISTRLVNGDSLAGLAIVGDPDNMISLLSNKEGIRLVSRVRGRDSLVASVSASGQAVTRLELLVDATGMVSAYYPGPDGDKLLNPQPLNAMLLPPWDRALRVGLTGTGQKNVFRMFSIISTK